MHVTRDFIKDEDITRELLEKNLRKISDLIEENNKWNLTDVNIICEEVFGKILNELFRYELVATSAEISGNFIAVDLIDYSNRVAFQVTSRRDRKKIIDTIEKFKKSCLMEHITSLNILVLGFLDGHKYDKPHEICINENNMFSFDENVFDFERLIEKAAKQGTSRAFVDMYDNINMIFDSGRLKMPNIVKMSELLSQSEYSSNLITGQAIWKKGYGTVQLTAFVPEKYGEEISALLEIRKNDMAGAYITFGQDVLINDFFVDEETFKRKHSVGREEKQTLVCLQIQCVRFFVDAHSAYQLYLLFAELHKEYIRTQNEILEELGAKKLEKRGEYFYLKSISEDEWREIKYFAQNHDCCDEEGSEEWNVFNSSANFETGLTILPYAHGTSGGGYIHAEICVKPSTINSGMRDVFWNPNRVLDECIKVSLDNVTRWKADYTLEWLDRKLLPEAHRYYMSNVLGQSENQSLLSKVVRLFIK